MVHLMIEDTREKYDIETLWTCGPEFDSRSHDVKDKFVLTEHADDLLDDDHDRLFEELSKSFAKKSTQNESSDGDGGAEAKNFRFGKEVSTWSKIQAPKSASKYSHTHTRASDEGNADVTAFMTEKDYFEADDDMNDAEILKRYSSDFDTPIDPKHWHGTGENKSD